jgi:hypothetical protein
MRRGKMQMLAVLVTVPLLMGSECPTPPPDEPDYVPPDCSEFSMAVQPVSRQVRPGEIDVRTVEIRRLIPGFAGPVRLSMLLEAPDWSVTIDPNPVTFGLTEPVATSTMTLVHKDWGTRQPGSWQSDDVHGSSPLTTCLAEFAVVLGAAAGDVVFEDAFDVGDQWEFYVSIDGEGHLLL